MAKFGFLLDNDVRHLQTTLPERQVKMLEDVGLNGRASDDEIVEVASMNNLIIVTNNARDFTQKVPARIGQSRRSSLGCTQVHGLIIIAPPTAIAQQRALALASKNLIFEGQRIGWKNVYEQALLVQIEASGVAKISRLPRCPYCEFRDAKAS